MSRSEAQTPPTTREQFVGRLAGLCLKSGLSGFPRKSSDRHILLKSVALTLDKTKGYTAGEIDERLIFWLTNIARSIDFDHVSLRRDLVDERYLERDKRGRSYRVSAGRQGMFAPEVEDVDVYESIGVALKLIKLRRRQYMQRQSRAPEPLRSQGRAMNAILGEP